MSTNQLVEATRFAKIYWYLTFALGTCLTIAVNAAHAKGATADPGTWTAMCVAMCPPLVFAILTEGYFLVRRSVPTRVQTVVKWSAGALALAAFAVSYETSRLFVIAEPGPLPEWTGWVIPGMVDALVAVSGYVLYVLSAHGNTADRSDSANSAPAPSPSRTSSARSTASVAETVSAVRDGASALPRVPMPPRSSVPTPTRIDPPRPQPVAIPRPVAVEESPKAPPPSLVDLEGDSLLPRYEQAAEWMLNTREVSRKSSGELVQIIALIERGKTSNEIRRELGGAAATYDKVASAWRRWKGSRALHGEPEVVPVG